MKRLFLLCLLQAFSALAFADQAALTGWTGGTAVTANGNDQIYGWFFDIGGSG
ncbi:MAG: hypothetical protein JST65_12475, partial [Acidobacteria bacterium]|nr:hypothetical protein [Acidobacteriota bacterium]